MIGRYATALFAILAFVGGPLTLHEGVLSQTTKAMLADHDWLVPRYGDAPGSNARLCRNGLPAICTLIGQCDHEWTSASARTRRIAHRAADDLVGRRLYGRASASSAA